MSRHVLCMGRPIPVLGAKNSENVLVRIVFWNITLYFTRLLESLRRYYPTPLSYSRAVALLRTTCAAPAPPVRCSQAAVDRWRKSFAVMIVDMIFASGDQKLHTPAEIPGSRTELTYVICCSQQSMNTWLADNWPEPRSREAKGSHFLNAVRWDMPLFIKIVEDRVSNKSIIGNGDGCDRKRLGAFTKGHS